MNIHGKPLNERINWWLALAHRRGFDFLHTPHLALVIGPYSPNLDVPVHTAVGIIKGNMAAGRIPNDGFLLLASVPYDKQGVDRARAELRSRFLSGFAAQLIRKDFPELARMMTVGTSVLDWRSRRRETLD